MITVTRLTGDDPLVFDVEVADAGGKSRHRVTLMRADWARLSGGRPPERPGHLIERIAEDVMEEVCGALEGRELLEEHEERN